MKSKILKLLFVALFIAISFPSRIHALGIGGSISGGTGVKLWNSNYLSGKENYISIGGNLLFDTCVSKDKLFNYRLKMGYNRYFLTLYDLQNVIVDNTFGFGFVRNKKIRAWAGFSIGLNYMKTQYSDITISSNYSINNNTAMIWWNLIEEKYNRNFYGLNMGSPPASTIT